VWSKDETKQITQSEHSGEQPSLDCPANQSVDYCIGVAEACFGVHKNENEDGFVGIRQGPCIQPVKDDPPVMSKSTIQKRARQPEGRRRQLKAESKRKVGYR
jgi:hypothetical protein